MSYRDYFGIFAILVGLLGCFFASRERKHLPLVRMSLYICLSLVLGYVDSCIPLFLPGLRLGLANVVVLIALLDLGYGPSAAVSLSRVMLLSLLRGDFLGMGFFMSLFGAVASYLLMAVLHAASKKLSPVFLSICGSLAHSLAQVWVACFYFSSASLLYFYLPLLSLLGLLTGAFSGILAGMVAKRIGKLRP